MADKIIVYGTDACPFCNQAWAAYVSRAIRINVNEVPEKLIEMLAYSGGKLQIPVIADGDKVIVGFAGVASLRGSIPLYGGN